MTMTIVHPIEPVYDEKSQILILGSFPSVKSREAGFYYGHPQNRFWKVLAAVLDEPGLSADFADPQELVKRRRQLLLDNRIAVWDVIHSCTITGSADDTIENAVVNDLGRILNTAHVSVIYINGSKAYELYNRYLREDIRKRYGTVGNAVPLPSTSPANAAWSTDKLAGAWKRIRIGLNKSDTAAPYYSMNEYCHDTFGCKLYRLSLDGGFTCPNRDGSIGYGGCIFCDGDGSGAFAGTYAGRGHLGGDADASAHDTVTDASSANRTDIRSQLEAQKKLVSAKVSGSANGEQAYIAYFQAYTGTYASVERLRALYYAAIEDAEVRAISIATRPDCLGPEVLSLIAEINRIKPVWIELGLQTVNKKIAEYIRRGYDLKVYNKAVKDLQQAGISQIITHVILGLPGESREDMLRTVRHVVRSGSNGIKLQLLHVLSGTDLADDYEKGLFKTLEMDEYISLLKDMVAQLPPDMTVHRLTGDGDRRKLIAPMWSTDKKRVLNAIRKELV